MTKIAVARCHKTGCEYPHKEVLLSVNKLRSKDSEAYKILDLPPFDKWDMVGRDQIPKIGGVYAIILDGKPMYIGCSRWLRQRILSHPVASAVRKMDGVFEIRFFETPHYATHEASLIFKHRPPLNINHNPDSSRKIHNHRLLGLYQKNTTTNG